MTLCKWRNKHFFSKHFFVLALNHEAENGPPHLHFPIRSQECSERYFNASACTCLSCPDKTSWDGGLRVPVDFRREHSRCVCHYQHSTRKKILLAPFSLEFHSNMCVHCCTGRHPPRLPVSAHFVWHCRDGPAASVSMETQSDTNNHSYFNGFVLFSA